MHSDASGFVCLVVRDGTLMVASGTKRLRGSHLSVEERTASPQPAPRDGMHINVVESKHENTFRFTATVSAELLVKTCVEE